MSLFFFNDTATTEIYTLSLHDALPISVGADMLAAGVAVESCAMHRRARHEAMAPRQTMGRMQTLPVLEWRSEEHTSELQSLRHLVCRLLLVNRQFCYLIH